MRLTFPALVTLWLSGCALGTSTPRASPPPAKPAHCVHYNSGTCSSMCMSEAATYSAPQCTKCEPGTAGEPPKCTTDFGCEQMERHAKMHACTLDCQTIPIECR